MTGDEGRLRDGPRIAQLFASELDGRSDRGLDRVAVTDASPDVEPTRGGARAFDVRVDGRHAATVFVKPERAVVELSTPEETVALTAAEEGLTVQGRSDDAETARLAIDDGAHVKRAVVVLQALLEADQAFS